MEAHPEKCQLADPSALRQGNCTISRESQLAQLCRLPTPAFLYCDNLIFRRRAALDQLGARLLDANRTIC
jgi:hypothetical protein